MNVKDTNDALLKAVEEDARREAERIIKEAEYAASSIIRCALDEAGELKSRRLSSLDDALKRKRASMTEGARIRAKGEMLKARRETVESATLTALERIKGLSGREYSMLLRRLYDELKASWDESREGAPKVLTNPRDTGILKEFGVEAAPDPAISLGVAFVSGDGLVTLENTVYSRMEKVLSVLSTGIDRILSI